MKKTYIITKDVKVPIVVNSGQAHRPAQVRYKVYRKGEMVQGELKHSNNKPAFILVGSMGVLPLNCVQEVTSVPVTSSVTGEATNTIPPKESEAVKEPKVQYGDALIIGALVGFVGVFMAQKYGYLNQEDKKLRLYGALGGGLLGIYWVYRQKNTSKKVKIVKSE
jgi:hypothetical protein